MLDMSPTELSVLRRKLAEQLSNVTNLRVLPFDDPRYEEWRVATGRLLEEVFIGSGDERHPCVEAFLSYRIPNTFSATRDEMSEYYLNILHYQSELLRIYVEDLENRERETAPDAKV